MSQVIARVVTGVHDTLRGPDVIHRIAIRREWLLAGETVELVLPRNLSCAACEGGGCDRCGRSGAITLRSRSEAQASVRVTLPQRSAEELREQPVILLRVPDHGGVSTTPDVPRGLLLLRVTTSSNSDAGATLAAHPAAPRADGAAGESPISSIRPKRGRAFGPLVLALVWIALIFALAAGAVVQGLVPLP